MVRQPKLIDLIKLVKLLEIILKVPAALFQLLIIHMMLQVKS